jgi:D-aminopeptidase
VRDEPLFAGAFTLNGNGECTGLEWIRESGLLTTPIALTNTHSVGVVRDALVEMDVQAGGPEPFWSLPVVGETYDGILNDIGGQHVTADHVRQAFAALSAGPVPEGSVGGGTGMICHEFKAGIGTASRVLPAELGGWTVGVLVQANHGRRRDLRIDGFPVGHALTDLPSPFQQQAAQHGPTGTGSIIVVLATDAPLLPDQCRRLAARATVGIGRAGGGCSDSSGDIFLAFATGNRDLPPENYGAATPLTMPLEAVPHQSLSPLLAAAADVTEEAILNAILAADPMTGRDDRYAPALTATRLTQELARYADSSRSRAQRL